MEQFVADIEPTLVPELEGSWELLEVFFVELLADLLLMDKSLHQLLPCIFFVFFSQTPQKERERERQESKKEECRGYSSYGPGYDCHVE